MEEEFMFRIAGITAGTAIGERFGDWALVELEKVSCPRWRLYGKVDRQTVWMSGLG